MRLLNAHSLRIHEFIGEDVPPYAILSHTWGEEEVSFKDMSKGRATKMKGYKKIVGCCRQARSDGFRYVASVCYAYLEDLIGDNMEEIRSNVAALEDFLRSSRWFTRGWTLQELISPTSVVFYTSEWTQIGTRNTMRSVIVNITGVNRGALGPYNLHHFSVAQKMSWASGRKTTRLEDEAYCLLGLFGVSMPLIYGEGEKAFRRLQEEIIKQSDDETVFSRTIAICFSRLWNL
ncbi:HET-domain-containing protein [Nemania abortiva]|nr:HET-domain-containing protein [Nemania abortiva]